MCTLRGATHGALYPAEPLIDTYRPFTPADRRNQGRNSADGAARALIYSRGGATNDDDPEAAKRDSCVRQEIGRAHV